MSERTRIALIAGLLAGILSGGGTYLGILRGRTEQKKLDEAECAAHPVVKEVRVEPPCPYPDGCVRISHDTYWRAMGILLGAPKPQKGSKRPALIGEANSPLNLKSGWTYENILVDEKRKTLTGYCPKQDEIFLPAQPEKESAPGSRKPDGTWDDVRLTVSYNWRMQPPGESPKPQITYFCPNGWEFKGAYSYTTGEVMPEYGAACVPAEPKVQ